MKQIVVKISPDGIIQAETMNMRGHECQKYIKSIEELTGAVSVDSMYKDEYYEETQTQQNNYGLNQSEEFVKSDLKL